MAPETPLEPAPASLGGGRAVFLKREDGHELGAFKWRGALPTLAAYREDGARAVVTASTGNHGAATAWAAARLGLEAIVYAPAEVSQTKLSLLERHGADVRLVGADLDEAKEEALAEARRLGLPFFEDGAEPAQFAGYAAIAAEMVEQLGGPPAAVVVPVGNGALMIGIGHELARRAPGTQRVGVVSSAAPAMALSFEAGRPVDTERTDSFADGLAVRVAIPLAVAELATTVDRMIQVSERELAGAVGDYARAGIRVEGAGAASLAALPHVDADGPIVLVVTGRNIDAELHRRACEQPESFSE
jgi:threonine dehydratase